MVEGTWTPHRDCQLGIGLVTVALTGYQQGRPWCRSDLDRPIDDDQVWLRGLVDGRFVPPPREFYAGALWEFSCAIMWTQNAAQNTP